MPTTRLGIDYLSAAQALKEVTVNNAFNTIDAGVAVLAAANIFTGAFKIARAAVTSGTPAPNLWVLGPADTGLAAGTEAVGVLFDLSATRQFATGALTTQRAMRITAPTYGFVGASTVTTAATLSISGAPIAGTNATITNPYALWVESGNSLLAGTLVISPPAGIRPLDITHPVSFAGASFRFNSEVGKRRTLIKLTDVIQMGTDSTYANAQDFWMQSLITGQNILFYDVSGLKIGDQGGTGSVNICPNVSHKLGFFNVAAVAQQPNASQAGITAVTDVNAKAALQALYNLLKNYGLAPATA